MYSWFDWAIITLSEWTSWAVKYTWWAILKFDYYWGWILFTVVNIVILVYILTNICNWGVF